jgi:predicted Zn-ribbon and HTH transcriptional regulator
VQSKDAILGSLTTGDPKAAPRHNPLSLTLAHSLAKLRKGRQNMRTEQHAQESPSQEEPDLLRFSCTKCGYGATSRHAPARCPMCNSKAWAIEGQPESTFLQDLDPAGHLDSATKEPPDADLPLARESSRDRIFPGVPFS